MAISNPFGDFDPVTQRFGYETSPEREIRGELRRMHDEWVAHDKAIAALEAKPKGLPPEQMDAELRIFLAMMGKQDFNEEAAVLAVKAYRSLYAS